MPCICPYCQKAADLVGGDVLYPQRPDLAALKFWRCEPCMAHVGCHKAGAWMVVAGKKIISDGTLPMGRLANAELRSAKQAAHAAFDPIWKSGFLSRRAAYTWLADVLGIPFDQCHIGEFDLQRCRQVVGISRTAGQPA